MGRVRPHAVTMLSPAAPGNGILCDQELTSGREGDREARGLSSGPARSTCFASISGVFISQAQT